MEVDPADFPQFDTARWPEFKERFAEVFATRTRDEWAALLEGEEACATAVYGLGEAASHPHNKARGTFVELDGMLQPAAAPRFDRTPGQARPRRQDGDAALAEWGVEDAARLRDAGALA